MNDNNIQFVGGLALLISVLAAIVVLALHGTINGVQAMTAIMALITLGGGAFAVHAGVSAGAKAAAPPDIAPPPARARPVVTPPDLP